MQTGKVPVIMRSHTVVEGAAWVRCLGWSTVLE